MTVTEAIEILVNFTGIGPDVDPVEFDEAVNLGAEALKNLICQRADWLVRVYKPLPGETKEVDHV